MDRVNPGRLSARPPSAARKYKLDPRRADLKEFILKMHECGVAARPPRAVLPLHNVPSPAETLHLRTKYGVTSKLTVYPEDVGSPAAPRILGERQMKYENNTVFGDGNAMAGYFVGSVYPDRGGRLLATVKYPEQEMVVLYFEGGTTRP